MTSSFSNLEESATRPMSEDGNSKVLLHAKSTSRYRAKIDRCFPANGREVLLDMQGCFLGISLETRGFTPPKVDAMVQWIRQRARKCTILIGDSIHRKTIQIKKGLPESAASLQALELGKQFEAENIDMLNKARCEIDISFTRCSDVQRSELYIDRHKAFLAQFDHCSRFRQSVVGFSAEYTEKKGLTDGSVSRDALINLSIEYFVEELAIFSCLVEWGYPVMIYPGTFSSLQEIVMGDIPALAGLSPRALFSLQLKGR